MQTGRRFNFRCVSAAASSTHEWKMSLPTEPGHVTLGLIRYLLIALTEHVLWAEYCVCVCACAVSVCWSTEQTELCNRPQEALSWSKPSDFTVPHHGSHVRLPVRPDHCHRFSANKALLCTTLHCQGSCVEYFSLEEWRQRESEGKPSSDTGQNWNVQSVWILIPVMLRWKIQKVNFNPPVY